MIDESRSRPNSRLVPKRTLRSSHTMLALATVTSLLLGGLVLAAPGQADPPDEADAPSSIEESAEPTPEPSESPEPNEQEPGDTESATPDPTPEPSESGNPGNDVGAKRPSPKPASPVTPAGVPLLVPAGGGAASGITDDLPVMAYLLVLLGMGSAVAGAAYLLRSR